MGSHAVFCICSQSALHLLPESHRFEPSPEPFSADGSMSPAGMAVTMNIGPLVLTNIGPPPGLTYLSRAKTRLR
jgi:hypothetical protein